MTKKKAKKSTERTDKTRTLKEAESVMMVNLASSDTSSKRSNWFTLAIILLPSFLAVLVPSFPNSPSNKDIAVLVTDTLIVLIVTFVIKFCLEWPWKWLQEVKEAKANLINRTNSTILMRRDDSFGTEWSLASDEPGVVESVLLIKKLVVFEWWVMLFCFLGVILSALLMVWTRSYIIVEETRRSIVFSNVNIGIFVLWSSFRVLLAVLETLKKSSLSIGDPEANEYNIANEANLHKFLKRETGDSFTDKVLMVIQNWFSTTFVPNTPKSDDSMKQVIENQQMQLERLNGKLKTLVITVEKLDRRISESKSDFKPFPLNLDKQELTESRRFHPNGQSTVKSTLNSTQRASVGSRLTTIFEEVPIVAATVPDASITSAASPIESLNEHHFSLHGLPFSSKIRSLVTRKKGHEIVEGIIKDYTSDHKLGEETIKDTTAAHNSLHELVQLFKQVREKVTLTGFLRHPSECLAVIIDDIREFAETHDMKSFTILIRKDVVKALVNETISQHLIGNTQLVRGYVISLCYLQGQRTKKVVKRVLHFMVDFPQAVMIFWYKLATFVPRRVIELVIRGLGRGLGRRTAERKGHEVQERPVRGQEVPSRPVQSRKESNPVVPRQEVQKPPRPQSPPQSPPPHTSMVRKAPNLPVSKPTTITRESLFNETPSMRFKGMRSFKLGHGLK